MPKRVLHNDYTKLDDNVAFQILRTNPVLSTNVRLMYDGENMYLDSYEANNLLSTMKYKHINVFPNGLFNSDLKKFWSQTVDSSMYDVHHKMSDMKICTDVDNMYENMYWAGVESIVSNLYDSEYGIVAPLYLKDKLPTHFVIFKINKKELKPEDKLELLPTVFDDNVENKNEYSSYVNTILKKSEIFKSFDLTDNSPLGKYIRNYISQNSFEFDKAMYVDNDEHNIYYYGIDRYTGQLVQKVENFRDELVNNDTTVTHMDDYFTMGFERNNLFYPYIMNIEFLFDDETKEDEYKFCRYFGMYCNALDLYEYIYETQDDIKKDGIKNGLDITNLLEEYCYGDTKSVFYVKGKSGNLYDIPVINKNVSVEKHDYQKDDSISPNQNIKNENIEFSDELGDLNFFEKAYEKNGEVHILSPSDVMFEHYDDMFGYETESDSVSCERYDDGYYDSFGFRININPLNGTNINIKIIDTENNDRVIYNTNLLAKDEMIAKINCRVFGGEKGLRSFVEPCGELINGHTFGDKFEYPEDLFDDNITIDDLKDAEVCEDGDGEEWVDLGYTDLPPEVDITTNSMHVISDIDGNDNDSVGYVGVQGEGDLYEGNNNFFAIGIRYLSEESNLIESYIKYRVNIKGEDLIFEMIMSKDVNPTSSKIDEGILTELLGDLCNEDDKYKFVNHILDTSTEYSYRESYGSVIKPEIIRIFSIDDVYSDDARDRSQDIVDRGYDYILRGNNYRKMFKLYPMTPGSYHRTDCGYILYSVTGSTSDVARAICGAINSYHYTERDIEAFYRDNYIALRYRNKGVNENLKMIITFEGTYIYQKRISMLTTRYSRDGVFRYRYEQPVDPDVFGNFMYKFTGGSNDSSNTFLVKNSDVPVLTNGDYGDEHFIHTSKPGVWARIIAIVPYVDRNGNVDKARSIMVTDENGKYIDTTSMGYVEVKCNYYPKLGVLSFLPVKDFDVDTLYSIYGECQKLKDEIKNSRIVGYDDTYEYNNKMNVYRFLDSSLNEIDNEYSYYIEYYMKSLSTISKTSPYIMKWVMCNDMKDSCENPYRLNVSKIFGANNFSSNVYFKDGNMNLYTHSMPYFMMPKYLKSNSDDEIDYSLVFDKDWYQYIDYGVLDDYIMSGEKDIYEYINTWNKKILNLGEDEFNMFFVDNDVNKRFSKKYSIIDGCTSKSNASTFFRGMKFNVIENEKKVNGMKVEYVNPKTGKYNGYKFSFLYIPIFSDSDIFDYKIYFIKNDICKLICGVLYINALNSNFLQYVEKPDDFVKNKEEIRLFNLSYIYNLILGNFKTGESFETISDRMVENSVEYSFTYKKTKVDECFKLDDTIYYGDTGIEIVSFMLLNILKMVIQYVKKYDIILKFTKDTNTEIGQFYITDVTQNSVKWADGNLTLYEEKMGLSTRISNDRLSFEIEIKPKDDISDYDKEYIFNKIKDSNTKTFGGQAIAEFFNAYSAHYIRDYVNSDSNVEYICGKNLTDKTNYDFKISIEEPQQLMVYDIFDTKVDIVNNGVDMFMKDNKNMVTLNRYSGFFEPLFRDVVFYNDIVTLNNHFIFSNGSFDGDYEDEYNRNGIIKNMFYHVFNMNKSVSENANNPLSDDYVLTHNNFNIFTNLGGYCVNDRLYCIKDDKSMFGSKVIGTPIRLSSETVNGLKYPQEYSEYETNTDSEIVYNEVNERRVEFNLYLRNRLLRYFLENEQLTDTLRYVNKAYEIGQNFDDYFDECFNNFRKEYIEKNIMNLYTLDELSVYVKSEKSPETDSRIENDYTTYLDNDTLADNLRRNGFEKITNVKTEVINGDPYNRKITYNLKRGYKETFAFVFSFIKI